MAEETDGAGRGRTAIPAATAFVFALILFGAGMLSSPSLGCPSLLQIAAFVVAPVLIPVAAAFLLDSGVAKLILHVEAVAIAMTALLLLSAIGCIR